MATTKPTTFAQLQRLEAEYSEAMRIGDRAGAGGILKRIRDLLAQIDPAKLQALIEFFAGLFGTSDSPAEAQALGASVAFSEGEAQALAISPQWLQLLLFLIELFRKLREAQPVAEEVNRLAALCKQQEAEIARLSAPAPDAEEHDKKAGKKH